MLREESIRGLSGLAAFAGLVGGLLLGLVLGFAAALPPLLADVLEPVMIMLNAIPRVILAPLFVIWLAVLTVLLSPPSSTRR